MVFRYKNLIYLAPKHIARQTIDLLPNAHITNAELEVEYAEAMAELTPLLEEREKITNSAKLRVSYDIYITT